MAFRNAVKATLLETEELCSRSGEPDVIVDAPEPVAPPPAEKPAPPRQVDGTAKPAPVAQPKSPPEASLGATWHARAEALCALADTLPSEASWSLISKIAGLYDELARDAGWTEQETPMLEPLEEAAPAMDEPPAAEDPPASAPLADPLPQDHVTFARRPQPLGRRFPRRRA